MSNDEGLKKTLQPVAKDGDPQGVEFRHTEQNADGSTSRQDRTFRYRGLDTTPTFSVSAENDEIVRVIGHEFPAGAEATLQAVLGRNSGDVYTDISVEGMPVVLTAEHNVFTVPFSGRFRFLFKDGWEAAGGARISVTRQERIPAWDGAAAPEWVPDNEWQCRADRLYERERNQFGRSRWVRRSADCGWVATGETQCRADGLYERERNRAGDFRWTLIATDCGWTATGLERCEDNQIEQQERNRAGDFRWVATGETCYDPTYPLPCGGWAFGPGDVRDPAATVHLTDCVTGVGQNIWVYPSPAPGRTFPVYDCMADFYCLDPDDIEGYAANRTITGIRNRCYDGASTGCYEDGDNA